MARVITELGVFDTTGGDAFAVVELAPGTDLATAAAATGSPLITTP